MKSILANIVSKVAFGLTVESGALSEGFGLEQTRSGLAARQIHPQGLGAEGGCFAESWLRLEGNIQQDRQVLPQNTLNQHLQQRKFDFRRMTNFCCKMCLISDSEIERERGDRFGGDPFAQFSPKQTAESRL